MPKSWLLAVRAAVSVARDNGAERVHLLPVRFGCLLAANANVRVDGCLFTAPVRCGREYLREEKMRKQLRAAMTGNPRPSIANGRTACR
ncbi:MAG: hypothetical protein U5N86_11590 [Planctomycetota bacterium]|nr:hypothetical protein [Planctomycetota bacterium]